MKLNKEQKRKLIQEFEKLNEPSQEDIFEQIQRWNDSPYDKPFKKLWTAKDKLSELPDTNY